MSRLKSTLPIPYPNVPRRDKVTCQTTIPQQLYNQTFKQRFPKTGAQDRILGHLLTSFLKLCDQHKVPHHYTPQNEYKALQILQQIDSL